MFCMGPNGERKRSPSQRPFDPCFKCSIRRGENPRDRSPQDVGVSRSKCVPSANFESSA